MPENTLTTLTILICFIFETKLWGKFYCYTYFINEDNENRVRLKSLFEVTQLVKRGTSIEISLSSCRVYATMNNYISQHSKISIIRALDVLFLIRRNLGSINNREILLCNLLIFHSLKFLLLSNEDLWCSPSTSSHMISWEYFI